MGGQALEAKRLTYAWRMHHLFEANASRLKSFATTLEIMVIVMTLSSTLASVVYSYLLSNGPKYGVVLDSRAAGISMMASNYGLVALNLFLPLAISVLRAMSASMTPYSKYTALRIATVKIQTEIYTYRTKTGKYNLRKVQKKDKKKDDKGGGGGGDGGGGNKKGEEDFKPSKLLGLAMDGVWADLLSSDIQKGALIAPQIFYDPMDSANLIINSNIRLQKMLTENLKPPPKNMLLEGAGALVGIGRVFYRYTMKQAMKVEKARKRAEHLVSVVIGMHAMILVMLRILAMLFLVSVSSIVAPNQSMLCLIVLSYLKHFLMYVYPCIPSLSSPLLQAWAATQMRKKQEEVQLISDDEEGSPSHKHHRALVDIEAGNALSVYIYIV